MIFNSLHYLIFLPLVTLLYFLLPYRYRWILLLSASYYFYMVWEPIYISLILISTIVDYLCGVKMGMLSTKRERKPYMLISVLTGLVILGTFKYYNFFANSMNDLFIAMNMSYMLPAAQLILPLGISFYTFQTLSYTIDVYKGKAEPERHLGLFALYVTFFPQLIAGPIERARNLLSQFHFRFDFNWTKFNSGLRLILLGLFKKIVVADQLSSLVGYVYDNPANAQGPAIYLASMFFIMQVYCDFSGYSDIARGSARLLGVELMENFKVPFFAKSFTVFWAQWHISLMNWFRDYIMFPLVKKKIKWPWVFMLVFLISGIWHGANWTFVVWGVYNGLMLVYAKATLKYRSAFLDRIGLKNFSGLRHVIQSICVVHIFGFSSIFFRAQTLHDSKVLIANLFSNPWPALDAIMMNTNNLRQDLLYLGKDAVSFYLIVGFIVLLELLEWTLRNKELDTVVSGVKPVFRYSFYIFVILSITLMSNVAEVPFIYFQF